MENIIQQIALELVEKNTKKHLKQNFQISTLWYLKC